MRTPLLLPLITALALAACNQDTDPGPGGVSVGEARALDEAAQMLEGGRPELPVDAPDADGDGIPAAQESAAAEVTPATRPTSAEESGGPQPATLPTAQ